MDEHDSPHKHPSIDDCLGLLRGDRDEQRLAGLLLVAKFCNSDDHDAIRRVYNALGVSFLNRLLRTGMEGLNASGKGNENSEAYLQLSVTVIAAFSRIPDIAASKDMVSKIPLIRNIVLSVSDLSIMEDCYEFLFLVSSSLEDGASKLFEFGYMSIIASQMAYWTDGSHLVELGLTLVQLMLNKISLPSIGVEDIVKMVPTIAKQFAVLHNSLKFEAFHLLTAILSSLSEAPFFDIVSHLKDDMWSTYIRVGVVDVLQNHVAPAEKLQALIIANSMMYLLGVGWLIGCSNLPDKDSVPLDRCVFLVLETSRVELAVFVNELAYLKYGSPKNSSSNSELILSKQRNLGVTFSLTEKIIRLFSEANLDEGMINENMCTKAINGLNETVDVVLEYLKDAKENEQNRGNDLLASVRVVGSYLSQTPIASESKVKELLGYMLSVEGEDESSPFYSICFLLPFLCQITMDVEGCKALISCGGCETVIKCLTELIVRRDSVEDDNLLYLGCDTLMNLLLKKDRIPFPLDESSLVDVLRSLVQWAGENDKEESVIMMASSICALIMGRSSEGFLWSHPGFGKAMGCKLSQLMVRSLTISGQGICKSEDDLCDIVVGEFCDWADRFPGIRDAASS